jgi:hypothetical protein
VPPERAIQAQRFAAEHDPRHQQRDAGQVAQLEGAYAVAGRQRYQQDWRQDRERHRQLDAMHALPALVAQQVDRYQACQRGAELRQAQAEDQGYRA